MSSGKAQKINCPFGSSSRLKCLLFCNAVANVIMDFRLCRFIIFMIVALLAILLRTLVSLSGPSGQLQVIPTSSAQKIVTSLQPDGVRVLSSKSVSNIVLQHGCEDGMMSIECALDIANQLGIFVSQADWGKLKASLQCQNQHSWNASESGANSNSANSEADPASAASVNSGNMDNAIVAVEAADISPAGYALLQQQLANARAKLNVANVGKRYWKQKATALAKANTILKQENTKLKLGPNRAQG